jgi:hypothetical protein
MVTITITVDRILNYRDSSPKVVSYVNHCPSSYKTEFVDGIHGETIKEFRLQCWQTSNKGHHHGSFSNTEYSISVNHHNNLTTVSVG